MTDETITGVVLLVPQAEEIVPWAHITLLAPIADDPTEGEVAELEDFFAAQLPFDFSLVGESRFPQGVRYLAPEPAAQFTRLTQGLHRLFPEYPPYRGAFELLVPHLTIPDDAALPELPILARASVAAVLRQKGEEYVQIAVFPLGTSAA